MKVCVSILHYKNISDTRNCLESLNQCNLNGLDIRTIVVDNSQEEKLEFKGMDKINLEIITSHKNLGFTGGHNLALDNALKEKFDVFLLLNNDCVVDKEFLQELLDPLLKKGVGATVSKIYFEKGSEYHKDKYKKEELGKVIWFGGGRIDWNNVASVHIGVDEVDRGQFDNVKEIDFATGACLAIKNEVIDKVGLFDDKYFLYYEDADLCMKILKAGYKILFAPKSVVWHKNAGSSGSGSKLHDYYLTRNRLYFGMKHAPLKMKILLLKEALGLLRNGREWQKIGVKDFLSQRMGKGSFNP